MTQTWSPDTYARNASFVPALGQSVLDCLAPQPGERILDLGCGDGTLTAKLVERGANVVGVDGSEAMVAAARAKGIDARLMDARALTFDGEFDAVFSNAVLHWVKDPGAVLAGVRRALRPGGRFVAEFGGHMNVAAIAVAIRAVLNRRGIPYEWPWYYPTPEEYGAVVTASGLSVNSISTFARPTPLPTGMRGWLATFRAGLFDAVPEDERPAVVDDIVSLLEPSLCDRAGSWTADYVRLQVEATRL